MKILSGERESRKQVRRSHRPNSGSGTNLQRFNSTGSAREPRDHSLTQFAVIDDDNVSAGQQMTKGGGGLTMASQWKSQFDDSEETTDNEWKQEPQSPEHKVQYITQQQHHHQQQHHYHTLPHQAKHQIQGNITPQPQSLQPEFQSYIIQPQDVKQKSVSPSKQRSPPVITGKQRSPPISPGKQRSPSFNKKTRSMVNGKKKK